MTVVDACEMPDAPPRFSPFSGIRMRTLIPALLISLVLTISLFVALHAGGALPFSDPAAQMTAFTVWLNGGLLGWCLWYARRRGISLRGFFNPLPPSFSWCRACAVLIPTIFANMGLMLLIFAIFISVSPELMTQYFNSSTNITDGMGSSYPILYFSHMLVALLLIAPMVEELFFRGFLINMWSVKCGPRAAVVLTAVVFAMAHIVQPGSFFLGIVAAIFYVQTRNLLVPMVLHFLNNLTAVTIQTLITSISGRGEAPTLPEVQAATFIIAVPLLIIGLTWLAVFIWRRFPSSNTPPPYSVANP